MKKFILVLILMICSFTYSQNDPLDLKDIIPKDIEYKSCVKKMKVTSFYLSTSKDVQDTVKAISILDFSKKGLIQQIKSYYSAFGNLWKITVFDDLGRVRTISNKATQDSDSIPFVLQYFSNDSKFPDSTIIKKNKNYIEKYINIFSKKLLIRQNHYVNDSLEDYRVYKYNKKNQLTEDFYYNSENIEGKTMISNIKRDSFQLSFYPEQLKTYEYYTSKDTNVVIIKKPKSSTKEIVKKVKNKKHSLEIIEKYDNNLLDEFTSVYTAEGIISKVHNRYNKNKAINNYYNTITTDTSYVAKYTTYENEPEKIFKIDIVVVYDKFNNWIKKTYSRNKILDNVVVREIEYYCH
nr:hypothetical protein [uncultured Flavobacterium sp.]